MNLLSTRARKAIFFVTFFIVITAFSADHSFAYEHFRFYIESIKDNCTITIHGYDENGSLAYAKSGGGWHPKGGECSLLPGLRKIKITRFYYHRNTGTDVFDVPVPNSSMKINIDDCYSPANVYWDNY
jgi:hypothetical protein